MLRVTLSRPFRFLSTGVIFIYRTLYNGYLNSLFFLFNGAFILVFGKKGYGLNNIEVGLAFFGLVVGISIVLSLISRKEYITNIRNVTTQEAKRQTSRKREFNWAKLLASCSLYRFSGLLGRAIMRPIISVGLC